MWRLTFQHPTYLFQGNHLMLSPLAVEIERETCPLNGSPRKADIFQALSEHCRDPIKCLWEISSRPSSPPPHTPPMSRLLLLARRVFIHVCNTSNPVLPKQPCGWVQARSLCLPAGKEASLPLGGPGQEKHLSRKMLS